ncbi:MAG TPA: FAD-binding protein, partial [Alphaproteobacteria bacterium]|nr:FAD-binding protein [Alphaproteobacteria bacterium]
MSAQPNLKHAPRLSEAAAAELAALLGERFTTSPSVRAHHGKDESSFAPVPPEGVAFAHSTDEVSAIVKICARHKIPVIAYGTGTSLEGHLFAVEGGITIDLSQMDKVLRVSADDLDVTVEAGVTRKRLNEHIRDTGLFFPIDPGADASLGGMAATRASGTNAVRYGTMRENVLGLTVVLADGRAIRTAKRARKSSAGYDLTRLFVGSEGTLGIITEITLRLYGIPEAISAAVCPFPTLEGAVRTVIETIQSGVPIARIEFLDPLMMRAVNRYSKLDYPESFTLFFEFHGSTSGVAEQVATVEALAQGHGAENFRWASKPEERSKLWQARHDAYFAGLQLRPGCRAISTDVCVP